MCRGNLKPRGYTKDVSILLSKDKGLNNSILQRAKDANFDVMALTVDTITGGNRERDIRTGFTSPPKFTLSSISVMLLNQHGQLII